MFEDSLVESTSLLRTHNRWPALASIGTQAVFVAVLLAIPLLHPEALVLVPNRLTSLAPPALRPTPPPVPPPQVVHVQMSSTDAPAFTPLAAPQLPRQTFVTDGKPLDAAALPWGTQGQPSSLPFSMADGSTTGSPRIVVATPSGGGDTHGPIRLSKGVTEGLLLAPIAPVYPTIARISRTEGVVVVQALISKTGRIESARAVSGPAMLQAAAVAAVQQARYRPYLLNGLPTEVDTTVTINFKLGS